MLEIKIRGLRKRRNERVFIGSDKDSMWKRLTNNTGDGKMGTLQIDSGGTAYVALHEGEDVRIGTPWTKTSQIYIPRTGDIIGILCRNDWRSYEVNL